jgi:hypothetical protein
MEDLAAEYYVEYSAIKRGTGLGGRHDGRIRESSWESSSPDEGTPAAEGTERIEQSRWVIKGEKFLLNFMYMGQLRF